MNTPLRMNTQRIDRADLRLRVLTGLSAAVIVVTAIVTSRWGLFAFCLVTSLLGMVEFLQVTKTRWQATYSLVVLAGVLYAWVTFGPVGNRFPGELMLLFPLVLVVMLFRASLQHAFRDAAFLLLGIWYVVIPFFLLYASSMLALAPVGNPDFGWLTLPLNPSFSASGQTVLFSPLQPTLLYDWRTPLAVLLLVWAGDVGGYFGGKLFGRHLLFPSISPKKTWEGVVGGLLLALAVAALYQALFYNGWAGFWHWYPLAVVIVVVGTFGDLAESMLKRSVGIKDSGGLLPGHGGLLDRFDGFLLAMPVVYLYLVTFATN